MRLVAAQAASRGILIRVSGRKFILVIEGPFDVAWANNGTAKSDVFYCPTPPRGNSREADRSPGLSLRQHHVGDQ
jgi:hypothetical protein